MLDETYILIYCNLKDYKDKLSVMKQFLYQKKFIWREGDITENILEKIYQNENKCYYYGFPDTIYFYKDESSSGICIFKFKTGFWQTDRYCYTYSGAFLIESNLTHNTHNIYCLQSLLGEMLKPHLDVEYLKYSEPGTGKEEYQGLLQYFYNDILDLFDEKSHEKKFKILNQSISNFLVNGVLDSFTENILPESKLIIPILVRCSDGEYYFNKNHLINLKSEFLEYQNHQDIYIGITSRNLQHIIDYVLGKLHR